MKYVYPVILSEEDGKTLVSAPDLPGCHTFGDTLADALDMAKDAISMWLWDAENRGEAIPVPSTRQEAAKACTSPVQFVTLVLADTDEYRRRNEKRAIKKTLSIPSWLNYEAEKAGAPFSQILQKGLKEYLDIQD